MAPQKVVLCDTNIFILFLKGDEKIRRGLKQIGAENIAYSIITQSEIVYGTRKEKLPQVKAFFNAFKMIHLNEAISQEFNSLTLRYSYSHHIKIPDALIAATAIAYGLELYTENKKDFDFIPRLRLYAPRF